MKLIPRMVISGIVLGVSTSALAIGPFSYSGSTLSNPDFSAWAGPTVADSETQVMTVEFDAGQIFNDPDGNVHIGFGARGKAAQNSDALGRGVIIGYLSGVTNCTGRAIAVENFTKNRDLGGQGVVLGSCVDNLPLYNNGRYKVTMYVSKLNVYWRLYHFDQEFFQFELLADGGCIQTAGVNCPEWNGSGATVTDDNAGDIFVGSAFGGPNDLSWWAWNIESYIL